MNRIIRRSILNRPLSRRLRRHNHRQNVTKNRALPRVHSLPFRNTVHLQVLRFLIPAIRPRRTFLIPRISPHMPLRTHRCLTRRTHQLTPHSHIQRLISMNSRRTILTISTIRTSQRLKQPLSQRSLLNTINRRPHNLRHVTLTNHNLQTT